MIKQILTFHKNYNIKSFKEYIDGVLSQHITYYYNGKRKTFWGIKPWMNVSAVELEIWVYNKSWDVIGLKKYINDVLIETTITGPDGMIQVGRHQNEYHFMKNDKHLGKYTGNASGHNYKGKVLILTPKQIQNNNIDDAMDFDLLCIPLEYKEGYYDIIEKAKTIVNKRKGGTFYYYTQKHLSIKRKVISNGKAKNNI